jgi:hypothetical protein
MAIVLQRQVVAKCDLPDRRYKRFVARHGAFDQQALVFGQNDRKYRYSI